MRGLEPRSPTRDLGTRTRERVNGSARLGWVKILFVGDVFGAAGRHIVREHLPQLMETHAVDLLVINGVGLGLRLRWPRSCSTWAPR